MPLHKLIVGFLLRFGIVYGLLIFPWPGWYETYGDAFRAVGNAVFDSNDGQRLSHFEAHRETKGNGAIDTRITLGNRDRADRTTGKGPASLLGLDTRSVGWVPVAWTVALIAATPIQLGRKILAIVVGLIVVNAFVLISVWIYIWNESSQANIGLVTLSPFWKQVADALQYTFVTQLGASFSIPVLIWIAVTFNRQELSRLTPELSRKTTC